MTPGQRGAVIYVAYATPTLDLRWIRDSAEVVVVHNDDSLDRATVEGRTVEHIDAPANVGFGAAVNLALPTITTERIILCNPDIGLRAEHYDALLGATADEVVTVPLVDDRGGPTSVVSEYPTPISHLASAYRLGRLARRGGPARRVASKTLGGWGRAHEESLHHPVGSWPLSQRWVSGAVFSVDTERLRAVGGFDERYFLYYEDVDLCRRLATRFPGSAARVADVAPGVHSVGGSAQPTTERVRRDSAARYAASEPGVSWRVVDRLIEPRRHGSRS